VDFTRGVLEKAVGLLGRRTSQPSLADPGARRGDATNHRYGRAADFQPDPTPNRRKTIALVISYLGTEKASPFDGAAPS